MTENKVSYLHMTQGEREALNNSADQPDQGEVDDGGKKSAATVLVGLAQQLYRFGVSDAGEPFGVPLAGPKIVAMLRGGRSSLRAQLAKRYYKQTGKAAPQQALADALLVIEGIAQDQAPEELHLRVARHQGLIWVDLGDETGRAIRISGSGWTLENHPPVLFKRTALMSALPEPAAGGDLAELWKWLNVTDEDRPLVIAWEVSVLFNMPHPILGLQGEQGVGKTTAERFLVTMLDPSPVPARKPPRDAESWVTAAAGSWVVGLDNLSTVPDWLSDSLCRAVTGDGDVRRRLYTDGDLAVFAFRRCIVLTGIDLGALRGDLAERLLPISLATIDGAHRLEEADLWPAWDQAHPRVLGALLDLAAAVMAVLPSVTLDSKPRMADFARVLAAVDTITGTSGIDRYLSKQASLATEALTGDPFIAPVAEAIGTAGFTGTSAELLAIVDAPDRLPKHWPANARMVTTVLRRQAPTMRKAGWIVEDDGGANHDGVARWTLRRPEMVRNPSPPAPRDPRQVVGRGEAGNAGHEYEQSQDEPAEYVDTVIGGTP